MQPGGDRWRWESRLFGGRYDEAPASERPVYGAWNRRGDPHGGAIRFGSAHLRLRSEVLDRCTFCFPDSVLDPTDFGGPEVLSQLSAMAEASGFDPGYRGQEYVDLARSLGDVLTPALLGDAARSGIHDAQAIKRVWHYLARFGRDSDPL